MGWQQIVYSICVCNNVHCTSLYRRYSRSHNISALVNAARLKLFNKNLDLKECGIIQEASNIKNTGEELYFNFYKKKSSL